MAGIGFEAGSSVSEAIRQQMLEKLVGDLHRMYEMLSNMTKSAHDLRMTSIRALRG